MPQVYQKRTPTETLAPSFCRVKKRNVINYLLYCDRFKQEIREINGYKKNMVSEH